MKVKKKSILFASTMLMVMLLVVTSNIAYANDVHGTTREFTKISILAQQKYCQLYTARAKETDEKYSYMLINEFNSCTSVDVRIATYGLSTDYALVKDYTIPDSNAKNWVRLDYTNTKVIKTQPIVLGARNSIKTSKTGYIAGYVNYY